VNAILVTERIERESGDESDDQDYAPPVAKKCRRSLPATVVTKEIPEYYGGKKGGARGTAARSKPWSKFFLQ